MMVLIPMQHKKGLAEDDSGKDSGSGEEEGAVGGVKTLPPRDMPPGSGSSSSEEEELSDEEVPGQYMWQFMVHYV